MKAGQEHVYISIYTDRERDRCLFLKTGQGFTSQAHPPCSVPCAQFLTRDFNEKMRIVCAHGTQTERQRDACF